MFILFFQAEDGIRDLVRSRGLGDVYKRQACDLLHQAFVDSLRFLALRCGNHARCAQWCPPETLSLIHI